MNNCDWCGGPYFYFVFRSKEGECLACRGCKKHRWIPNKTMEILEELLKNSELIIKELETIIDSYNRVSN